MKVRRYNIENSLKWFSCGQRLVKKNATAWTVTAIVVFIFSWLLLQIPILGQLMLVFVLPIIAASSLGEFHLSAAMSDESRRAARRDKNPIQLLQKDLFNRLFGIFKQGDRFVFVLLFSFVALCAALGINILEQLIAGPARLESVSILDVGFGGAMRYLTVQIITMSAYAVIIGTLLFTMPLVTLLRMGVGQALQLNLAAWLKNFVPLIAYFGVIVGAVVVGRMIMAIDSIMGLTAMFLITLFGGPLMLASAYCCFRLMYRND